MKHFLRGDVSREYLQIGRRRKHLLQWRVPLIKMEAHGKSAAMIQLGKCNRNTNKYK